MPDTLSINPAVFFALYLLATSLATFILYGADKRRSRGGKWRISEKTLLWLGILGGAAGGLVGMKVFHHKTRHRRFWVINIFSLIIHALILAALASNIR